jgi:hypothetical protein
MRYTTQEAVNNLRLFDWQREKTDHFQGIHVHNQVAKLGDGYSLFVFGLASMNLTASVQAPTIIFSETIRYSYKNELMCTPTS